MRLDLDRRQLLLACGASLAFPLPACAAQAQAADFIPESFGAVGDGVADDYDAFVRLVAAVNLARGGSVALSPGRTYYFNRYRTEANPTANITFDKCDGLTLDGNGAIIAVKGDFQRDRQSTRSLSGLVFEDCRNVMLRNLQLTGNVGRMNRVMTLKEPPSHGLIFGGCSEVVIDGVTARHFAGDGLYIRQGLRPNASNISAACRRFTVRNSQFLFNARQGLSVIQLRGGRFDNCDFSHTGYVAPEMRGPYGSHAPSAGVDIEPNHSPATVRPVDVLTGDLEFENCRMVGNRGISLAACKYGRRAGRFVENIRVRSCHLQCDQTGPSRYGFIFDVPGGEVSDCTLHMLDRTAFIGWYRISDASPRFVGNSVYGRNPGPGHPLLHVRATLGGPIVEGNRLFVSGARSMSEANRPSIIVVDNPNAIVRDNQVLAAP